MVDISAPSHPVLVGNIDTGGVAVDVEVSGRFVYLVDLISGLKLFDLNDPSNPVMSGQWSTSGLARRVAKVGPWAWVTVIDFGIEMADVTNIPNSSKTIALELQPHAEARDVEVVGQVAYLADGPAGIQILDASDSLNPQRISHLDTDDEIWDLEVIDDVLYAASGTSGLEIFDVSDPHKPRSLGHLDTSGSTRGLAVVGDLAYVADGENGLIIIDVSHASNPILVGELVTSGFAWDVAVTGTMAYLSDGPSGLQIIDVTDPAHPVIQSRFGLVDIRDFEVVDHVGYAVLDHRLWLVDLTEPKNPGTLGFISFAGPVFDVDVQGGLAFVAADSRLDVIDVSNPKNPVFVTGTKANGRAMGVTVIDRAIYLASGTWGLLVGSLPPIAHAQVDFTTMESPITINLNGIDLDGTALTFSVDRPPYQGIVSGAPPHLTYSPDELYWGEDSFTFHASSGGQDSLPATVRIHISPRDPYVYDNGETFWQTGTFSLFRQTVADDFILDESATITGVSVDTFNELRGNFTWRIYEDNDGLPGQLIASGSGQDMISKLVSTLPNNSRYYNVHFNFGREVFLKKSTPYWLGLRTTSSVRWVYSKRRGHPIVFQGGSTQNWMPLLSSQFGSAFRLSGFPNHRPIALLELSPVMPKDMSPALPWVLATDSEKASVVLDGSLSTDQDGDSLTFAWYLTPSAVPFATSMEAILSVPIGEHTVSLVVDDGKERSTNSVTFQVITPCHALNQIREQIVESSIPEEQLVRPLIVLLQAACASFDRKKTVTGLQQLRTLQTLSQAKLADSFPELAENLIRAVNSVIRPILAESRLLHLQRFNHDLELIWADGQLQEADTPTGPWRDVTNAHSPFSVNPNGEASSRFYRIRTVPLEAPESSLE